MSNRKKLVALIKEISNIVKSIPSTSKAPVPEPLKKELIQKISTVDCHTLGFYPLNPLPPLDADIVVAEVYSYLDKIIFDIFMLANPGSALPLHDHPLIDGFIRPITGKLLINSYSWLDEEEEKSLIQENFKPGRPARYDGSTVISSDNPQVVTLSHRKGNVHSIHALEPASAFFDVLIPDYGNRSCTYYECEEVNPAVGEIYWLKPVPLSPPMIGAMYSPVTEFEINNSN